MLHKWSLLLFNHSHSYGGKVSLKVNITSPEENMVKHSFSEWMLQRGIHAQDGWSLSTLNLNVKMLGLWHPT